MEVGLVRSIDIDHEMQQAYLDYAMSVIVARALPDARDGLKPVHRRILYAMYDMGLRPDSSFKKSARIVGEVLGKYHPHGDMAVYESMARMAQDFSMRTLLVEGQGNFGSVDGDPPAAMRYTEARLANPAMHLLADIRKNTVDFSANFDGSLEEPDVLPAALPNLLVNGATGIAVGMSTNVPPHNLGEVIDALVHMLSNWDRLDDINVEDLMRFIQGPDFPTGGIIIQGSEDEDLKIAYGAGRGRITVQARAHLEVMDRGRSRIIVNELPYLTNKSSLIERIAELARESKIEGIADLRDESDRQGLRIVIELTRTADPEVVLKDLYKNTPMRTTFGIIMLALVEGEPRLLSLKQALRVYLEHRLEVIRRRAEFDLEKARQRAHVLEGLLVALKYLDEVIDLIRRSPDADVARQRLMKKYRLSEVQAQAILDMPLRRLAALERKKIEDEYKELKAQIKELEGLLKSPVKMRQLAAEELKAVKEAFADRRRTQIARPGQGGKTATPLLTASELLPQATVWISATAEGLVSRSHDEKPPRISGAAAPLWCVQTSTRDVLYLVADNGEAACVFVHALPEAETPAEGTPLHKASPLPDGAQLCAMFALPPREERAENQYVFTCTRQGLVKKSALAELPPPSARPFTLVKVNEGDTLGWVRLTDGQAEVLLATADGMAIRFKEDEVRPMGLVAAGVGGIKLQARDEVVGMELVPAAGSILFVASDGKAKRLPPEQFPIQGRYGQGVMAWRLPRTAQLAGIASGLHTTRVTLHIDRLASKAMRLDEAPEQTRAASGKSVLDLRAGYKVVSISVLQEGPASSAPVESGETKKRARATTTASSQATAVVQATFEDLLEAKPARKTPAKAKTGPTASDKPAPKPKSTTGSSAAKAKATPKTATPAQKAPAGKPAATRKPAAQKPGGKAKTTPKTGASKSPAATPAEKKPAAKTPVAKSAVKPSGGRKPATGAKETKVKPASSRKPGAKTTPVKKPAETPPGRRGSTKTPAGAPAGKTTPKKPGGKATPRKPAGK